MPRANETTRPDVVIVDDDRSLTALVARWLEREGCTPHVFHDGASALAGLGAVLPDTVCLDLNMPGLSGIETLERIKERHPRLPVIILTADTSVDSVVTTMQLGAYDYLSKPIDRNKLGTTVRNAVERHRLRQRLSELERDARGGGFAGIVGRSPTMRQMFRQMDRVASSDIAVLIHGESGAGKELVARAIHDYSGRRARPFVALNCAAIPENLQESELFGHERGAFTGATQQRTGRFEQADGGTLFLDEVAELSPSLQAKLLRVLQELTFRRVGGTREIHTDFRLVAASHRRLTDEVEAGRFREDLYFRIAVFDLDVPPLRDRREDIPLLVDHLLEGMRRRAGAATVAELEAAAMECLMAYDWPGNVRELHNALERAAVVATGELIRTEDLPARVAAAGKLRAGAQSTPAAPLSDRAEPPQPRWWADAPAEVRDALARFDELDLEALERVAIIASIARNGGNLSAVVRDLGIGRTTLYRKLKRYGLER